MLQRVKTVSMASGIRRPTEAQAVSTIRRGSLFLKKKTCSFNCYSAQVTRLVQEGHPTKPLLMCWYRFTQRLETTNTYTYVRFFPFPKREHLIWCASVMFRLEESIYQLQHSSANVLLLKTFVFLSFKTLKCKHQNI